MARKGGADRGLVPRKLKDGKQVWYTRPFIDGRERWFGPFVTKSEARLHYQKVKTEQSEARLFPERYQHRGAELIAETIDNYLETATHKKAYVDEAYFGRWWKKRLAGRRLKSLSPGLLDGIRYELLKKGNGRATSR